MFNLKKNPAHTENFTEILQKNITSVFIGVVVLLLVAEGFVVQNSIKTVVGSDSVEAPTKTAVTAQINFTDYDNAIKKVGDAGLYHATSTPLPNPFVYIPSYNKPSQ